MGTELTQASWTKVQKCITCGAPERSTKYINGVIALDVTCMCYRYKLANIEPNTAEADAFREVMPMCDVETIWFFVAGKVRVAADA